MFYFRKDIVRRILIISVVFRRCISLFSIGFWIYSYFIISFELFRIDFEEFGNYRRNDEGKLKGGGFSLIYMYFLIELFIAKREIS